MQQNIIYFIILVAVFAVILVALPAMGIAIPHFVLTIGWILVITVIVIMAIKFLFSLGNKP